MTNTLKSITVEEVEEEIDRAFATNALKEEGYTQAVWTLLSQMEDAYLKAIYAPSHDEELHIFTDLWLNSLTYPLRVCHNECAAGSGKLIRKLVNDHYQLAVDWLGSAYHGYYSFCAIFPLWHRQKVEISISGNRMTAKYVTERERAYEVYNRLIRKDARPEKALKVPVAKIADAVLKNTSRGEDWFQVNFNPHLVAHLVSVIRPVMEPRYSLPSGWAFGGFTLEQYKSIFITLQAMLCGWTVARNTLASNGLLGLGYKSSVWVVSRTELVSRLRRYTAQQPETIERVLTLITFGSSGVLNPDIAIQPLVDLRNDFFALSPFVWLNTSAERNLCVLLNQIPEQKEIYERLKNEKESLLKAEMIEFLTPLGLDVKSGTVDGTDLDIAIIDRKNKDCLCLELKWFIEPAEVREGEQKTKELKKGVAQAKRIKSLYESGDPHFSTGILDIDASYFFLTGVASVNWIGHADAQDADIPIVKVWHLLHRIRDCGSLRSAMNWLSNREYMPKEGTDFAVVPVDVTCGNWTCEWYAIKPLFEDEHP